MVKQSFPGLPVFVSTVPAAVTTRHSVTPPAYILGYRDSNGRHVDGLFRSERSNA
jgi:hypothetical protein